MDHMKQTVGKQVKSGLRLGVGAGLFLIGGMLLSAGMGRIVWSATSPHYVVWSDPVGWTELALSAAALIASAGVWWQVFAGYMLIGSLKSVIVLITGRDLFAPYGPFPRSEAAAFAAFGVATILLMWRFTKNRPTILDRIALTAYVFCFAWRADRAEFSDFGLGLIAGLGFLIFASAYDRIRRHRRPDHGSSSANHVTV
jgi:hypothetical protein